MSKVLGTMAAFALLATLALPGSATAAERRADGLKLNQPGAETEFSSYHRRWHRPYWRHRYGYYRPWGYRYGYYRPWYRPYYRPWYAGYPYYRPYPAFSIGFGFGPRWGW